MTTTHTFRASPLRASLVTTGSSPSRSRPAATALLLSSRRLPAFLGFSLPLFHPPPCQPPVLPLTSSAFGTASLHDSKDKWTNTQFVKVQFYRFQLYTVTLTAAPDAEPVTETGQRWGSYTSTRVSEHARLDHDTNTSPRLQGHEGQGQSERQEEKGSGEQQAPMKQIPFQVMCLPGPGVERGLSDPVQALRTQGADRPWPNKHHGPCGTPAARVTGGWPRRAAFLPLLQGPSRISQGTAAHGAGRQCWQGMGASAVPGLGHWASTKVQKQRAKSLCSGGSRSRMAEASEKRAP